MRRDGSPHFHLLGFHLLGGASLLCSRREARRGIKGPSSACWPSASVKRRLRRCWRASRRHLRIRCVRGREVSWAAGLSFNVDFGISPQAYLRQETLAPAAFRIVSGDAEYRGTAFA